MGHIISTASGQLVSANIPKNCGIRSLKVHFSPKQSGTGDPTPSNVRAISGWTGLDVYQTGGNLITSNVQIANNKLSYYYCIYFPIPTGTFYYTSDTNSLSFLFLSDDVPDVNTVKYNPVTMRNLTSCTIDNTDGHKYLVLMSSDYSSVEAFLSIVAANHMRIVPGSSSGTYETPNALTLHQIDWSSSGTLYGGYVDLVTGEVWETHNNLHFISSYFIGIIETTNNTYAAASAQIANIATTNNVVISDKFKGISNNNPTESGLYEACVTSERRLYIGLPSELSSLSLVKSWIDDIDGFDVAYKLATPQLATTLTPETINTIIGTNTFWSNADSVEVEYESQYVDDVIESYRRRILMSLPHPETASGTIANFKTDMHAKLKECKVEFSPYQDGTGDPSPSNVRSIRGWTEVDVYHTGKNIGHIFGYSAQSVNLQTSTRSLTNNYGTTISTIDYSAPDTPLVITQSQAPNTSSISHYRNGYFCVCVNSLTFGEYYDFSFRVTDITSNPLNASFLDIKIIMPGGSQTSATTIIDDRLIFKNIQYKQLLSVPTRQTIDIRISGMSFTFSEFMVTPANKSDGVFEPYSCTTYPITFPMVGKNLLELKEENIIFKSGENNFTYQFTNTGIKFNVTSSASNFILFKIADITEDLVGKRVIYSGSTRFTNDAYVICDSDGSNRNAFGETSSYSNLIEESHVGRVLTLRVYPGSNIGETTISNMQVEYGTSASSYEPYGRTVFGGYVDLATGNIWKTWHKMKLSDARAVQWSSSSATAWTNYQIYQPTTYAPITGFDTSDCPMFCDTFLTTPLNGGILTREETKSIVWMSASDGTFRIKTQDYCSLNASEFAEQFKDAEFVYKLATPVLFGTITPETLKTLKGTNNIWSSANDNVAVKYWKH